jgi:hypothetical protein
MSELAKILAWLFAQTQCKDCRRGSTAVITKKSKGYINLCPRHAMEYVCPSRKIQLRTRLDVKLPTYIGDKPDD